MTQESRDVLARKCEETLRRVKDVMNARVVLGDDGNIEEIHILAGPGRSAKHIGRDVESSIVAAFGLHVDRRKISIAQIGNDSPGQGRRVLLERIEIISSRDLAEVRVHLSLGGETKATGVSSGIPTPTGWLWAAAGATVSALNSYMPVEASMNIEDVSVSISKSRKVVLVGLTLAMDGKELFLTGSCPVAHDEREAVVKATLDAVNRKLGLLVTYA